jgi:dCTP deaminase
MILPDREIKKLILDGIVNYATYSQINPWSLDVRLSEHLLIEERPNGSGEIWRRVELIDDLRYQLFPQEFALGNTIEQLNLPDDIGAELYLKSSRAREGYDHAKAVWIDPGFTGSITLEVRNNLRFNSIDLYCGLAIAQLVFYKGEKPDKSYRETGRYNGFTTVQASLDDERNW